MLPLRVVLDTNVVVSAALRPDGLPRTVFLLALTPPARFYVTVPILAEYEEVLARPRLRIRKGLRSRMLQMIENRAHLISPTSMPMVTADAGDNMFMECAAAARADYLVTGNLRHFPRYWRQTKIITSREFLTLAAPHLVGIPPRDRGGEP